MDELTLANELHSSLLADLEAKIDRMSRLELLQELCMIDSHMTDQRLRDLLFTEGELSIEKHVLSLFFAI